MTPGYSAISKLPASRSISVSFLRTSRGGSNAILAVRISWGVQRSRQGVVTVFPPVGLNENGIDLLQVHDPGLIPNGLNETG